MKQEHPWEITDIFWEVVEVRYLGKNDIRTGNIGENQEEVICP